MSELADAFEDVGEAHQSGPAVAKARPRPEPTTPGVVFDPDNPSAALEAATAGGDDSDDSLLSHCVPDSFDFFEVDARKLRSTRDAGNDPRIARVRFKRYVGAKRIPLPGEFDASMVNLSWLLEKQPEHANDWPGGPGRYEVGCLNESGNYVTGKSVDVGTGAAAPAPPPQWGQPRRATTSAHWQGAYAQPAQPSITDQILSVAMERLLNPPAPPPDPMKDTVSTMLKMMQLQQTQALEQLRVQAQIASKPTGQDDLTKLLLAEVLNGKRSSPMDGMREMLDGFMAFRALMGSGGEAPDPADPPPHWIKLVDSAINEMGPGVTSLAAHAILGDEGAASIDDMIKKQMEAREAEAKAAADVIDVPGTSSDGK